MLSCKNEEKPKETAAHTRPSQPNPLTTKYSGAYMVEVKGASPNFETEGYALKNDGSAVWFWIINDGHNGAEAKQKKYGTWTVDENKITISIKGNSGDIVETYIDKVGKLVNEQNPDRVLIANPY